MLFQIAWKNVWRNKLRSLIVILSITIGLFGGLFYLAFSNGMAEYQINSSIKTEISHIQIHNPAFLVNDEIKYAIDNPDEIMTKLKSIPNVKAVASRIKSMAMISSAATGTGVTLNGIDVEDEKQISDLNTKVTKGSYFDSKLRNPIVIGKKLAKKLKVKVKSKVVVTIQDMNNNITYGAFKVAGIYDTHNSMFDLANAFVTKGDLANLLQFDNNKASQISLLLDNNESTEMVMAKIKNMFAEDINNKILTVRSWGEINPILKMLNEMTLQFTMIFVTIILVALSFGIINTMLMAIMERVREIGMLMAIGMSKAKVFLMIMLETVFLSITGGIIGLLISWVAVSITHRTGIDLSSVAEGLNAIGYSSFVRPELGIVFYLLVGLLVIFTAIFASIFPARKALKLKPSEAIRQDV